MPVEGFDVFKSSKKARAKGKAEEQITKNEIVENPKKELNRQMEVLELFLMLSLFHQRQSVTDS